MTALYLHEWHQRRRLLKRSNPPFFRQMPLVASTALLKNVICPRFHRPFS
jgi:hypothetical protein